MTSKITHLITIGLFLFLVACGALPENEQSAQEANTNAQTTPTTVNTPLPPAETPTIPDFANEPTPTPEARLPKADPITKDQEQDTTPVPVSLTTADQVTLAGTYYPPKRVNAPSLLLLHMLDGSQQVWADFIPQAHKEGYAILSIDLRGHGESKGEQDFAMMDSDVSLALNWLAKQETVDVNRIGIIGADIGANLALRAGANHPMVKAIVLLSPASTVESISTETAITDYGNRPLLVVAAKDDTQVAEASQELADIGQGITLQLYDGTAHGTEILEQHQDFANKLFRWLAKAL